MRESNGTFYFLCGLGIGAMAATIFAAKSGAETRAQIASTVGDGVDQLKTGVDLLKTKAQDLGKTVDDSIQAGRQVIRQRAGEISDAVEAGKQAYRETLAQRP